METGDVLARLGAVCGLAGPAAGGPVHGALGQRADPVSNRRRAGERVAPGAGALHRGHLLRTVPGRQEQEVRPRQEAIQRLQ